MINYEDVGKRVRFYRRKCGFTQEQLAFDIQTSAAYLSNIERATKKPSLQKLMQIAEALDITIEDLISNPSPTARKTSQGDNKKPFFLCSASEKERLINNLLEIINILEQNS